VIFENPSTLTLAIQGTGIGALTKAKAAVTLGREVVQTGVELLIETVTGFSIPFFNPKKLSPRTRANQTHEVLSPRTQRMQTTAVTETAEGTRVVSSSTRRLTPAQRAQLQAGEIEGVGIGHAEVTSVNAARRQGLTPTGTASSRPICPNCAEFLNQQGVKPLSPLKKIPNGG